MASITDKVLFEYEDETRYYTWQAAHLAFVADTQEMVIQASRGSFTLSIPVSGIRRYETVLKEDISYFSYLMGAVLGDWTGILLVLLAPIAIIDAISSRRTPIRVVKLSCTAPNHPEQEITLYLRSRHRRDRGQIESYQIAGRIMDFLLQNGYSGPQPDLEYRQQHSGDVLWR